MAYIRFSLGQVNEGIVLLATPSDIIAF